MLGVAPNGHFPATFGIQGLPGHALAMRFKAIAGNFQTFQPVVCTSKIRHMNPLFPKFRGISAGIEFRRPLQKPKDINPSLVIINRPTHDRLNRKRTNLNLDGDWDAIHVCADVRADGSKRTLQRNIANMRLLQQRLVNLHLASAMLVRFALGEFAGDGVSMSKVVDAVPAAFQKNRITTNKARKRAVELEFRICGDGMTVGFAAGKEHGWIE